VSGEGGVPADACPLHHTHRWPIPWGAAAVLDGNPGGMAGMPTATRSDGRVEPQVTPMKWRALGIRYGVTRRPGVGMRRTAALPCVLAGFRQDLGVVQGWLERSAAWLEAGQKRLPEEV